MSKDKQMSEEYLAGYDAARNGANMQNSNYSYFNTVEGMKQWQSGYDAGKQFKQEQKPDYLTKISGKHFDKDGDYFVLRLDGGNTLKAAREAINVYADGIEKQYPEVAKDLRNRYPIIK